LTAPELNFLKKPLLADARTRPAQEQ